MAAILAASYMLHGLGNLEPALTNLRPFLITAYYQGGAALNGGISWWYTGGMLGVLAGSVLLTIPLFLRRDLAVGHPFSLKILRIGRKSVEHKQG